MKKTNIARKILSFALALVMVSSAFAVIPYIDDGQAFAATLKAKTKEAVNVRSGAGASYAKLGTLAKGKTFTVNGVKTDTQGTYWYKTTYNSKTGYVSSKYAVRTGYKTSNIASTKGTVTGTDINVRLGPGTIYKTVASVSKGQTYTVDGKSVDSSGNTWYRMSYKGFKVYIVSSYMSLDNTAASTQSEAEATTQPTTTQPTTTAVTLKAKVKQAVNVRTGTSATSSKLGTMAKGTTFTVLGAAQASDGVFWYVTSYKSKTAYVSSKYAVRIGYSTTTIANDTGTASESTDMRLGPGAGYQSIGQASAGQAMAVDGRSTDSSGVSWYRCTYSGFKVYVDSTKMTLASALPPVTVTTGGLTYPTSLAKGKSFTLTGTLTATQNITKVETGIVNSSGAWVSGYLVTDAPNSTTYDINKSVDDKIKFGKLEVGSYSYRCNVTTQSGSSTAFDYPFTVSETPAISFSGLTFPTTLTQYKSFTLNGKVNSTQTISSLTLGITDYNGAWLSGYNFTVNPNAKTYDLSKLDNSIKFGNLPTGSYCYKCVATTGTLTQTLFSYTFVVNKNTGIPSALPYGGLTGVKANDIVAVAMAQNGYSSAKENHTAYNLWYYGKDQSAAWCAIFVSWCASQCGISTGVIPKMAYVPSITSWYKSKGKFNAKKTLPQKGDLIIYAGSRHIGIVTETVTSSSGKVSTIEGNTGNDQVKYRQNYMKWNSSAILGYCHPSY